MPTAPLVSVLMSVADGERFLRAALESVLRQSVGDLELIVVDDASSDGTGEMLARVDDPRVRVLRNEARLGLAGSLNRALDEARGTSIARMDADDVALPGWLERVLPLLASDRIALGGSGVLDVDERGRPRETHLHEPGRAAMRWRALFSAPVFHDTAVVVRDVLERHGLRYDTAYAESEDYDLWTRLLEVADGDVVEEPLVLHRLHGGQASRRRGDLQRTLAHEISLREIARLEPELPAERASLVRRLALGSEVPADDAEEAALAFVALLDRFAATNAYSSAELGPVSQSAARALLRAASGARGRARARMLREAARLDPALPAHAAARRLRRRRLERSARTEAARLLASLPGGPEATPVRVAAVFPEPTPYRAPLLDRVSELPEIDLDVIYAAETVAGRTWRVDPKHEALFLRGVGLPGADRVLHHDYPITPGIRRALADADPDVVVASGWSTFASQAAIAWSRTRGIPYVLVVESHDEGPRPGWRRRVKGAVVPRIVRGASGVLVTGTLARRSMVDRGAAPERVHVFANTIDVEAFGARADRLASRRDAIRAEVGAEPEDVVVLSVARLAPEKGLETLVHAVAEAGDPRLLLVLVGEGPEHEALADLAEVRGVRLVLAGDVAWERIVEAYVAADVFALLSEREPWAVVVNEAASCGLPLLLSDRVGAAHDLLRQGENGFLVAAGDVGAAAEALRTLAADSGLRSALGARSRELARDWGYGPSVDGFATAVREAVEDGRRR